MKCSKTAQKWLSSFLEKALVSRVTRLRAMRTVSEKKGGL